MVNEPLVFESLKVCCSLFCFVVCFHCVTLVNVTNLYRRQDIIRSGLGLFEKMTFLYMHSKSAPGRGQEKRDASRERARFLEIGEMEFLF